MRRGIFVGTKQRSTLFEAGTASLVVLALGFCAGVSSSAAADRFLDEDRCAQKSPPEQSIVVATQKAAEGETPYVIVTDEGGADVLQPIAKVSEYVPDLADPLVPTRADPIAEEASDTRISQNQAALAEQKPAERAGPIEPEAISFHGITPGLSKRINVLRTWGDPRSDDTQASTLLYKFDNLPAVHVHFKRNRVESIAVQLEEPVAIATLARKLDLGQMRAATITDATGANVGQSFPERGVELHFDEALNPLASEPRIGKIVILPITSHPFLLRANETAVTNLGSTIDDLETALRFDRTLVEARDHLSEIYLLLGKAVTAERYSSEAVEMDPGNPRYRLQLARCLRHLARYDRAVEEARQVLETPSISAILRAQALNEMGLLAALGSPKVAQRAMPLHSKAIVIADGLSVGEDIEVSQQAKQLLVEAHLAIAVEISQGEWQQKDESVPQWIERASALAEAAIDEDEAQLPLRLKVAVSALAAAGNLEKPIDPMLWIEEAEETAAAVKNGITDPQTLGQYDWLLGLAYFHGSQIQHRRSEADSALQLGEQADQQLSELAKSRDEMPDTSYLMGRLYFQIGAVHAVHLEDHGAACLWYDQAVDRLLDPVPVTTMATPQQHGDALVSMGVSYWDQQDRDRAIEVTESGVDLIEQAVGSGLLDANSLLVPYNNLAAMYQAQGEKEPALRYQELAKRIIGKKVSQKKKRPQRLRR